MFGLAPIASLPFSTLPSIYLSISIVETEDWNIVCEGTLSIDRETSTAIIEGI
jgi:hypothetical protein